MSKSDHPQANSTLHTPQMFTNLGAPESQHSQLSGTLLKSDNGPLWSPRLILECASLRKPLALGMRVYPPNNVCPDANSMEHTRFIGIICMRILRISPSFMLFVLCPLCIFTPTPVHPRWYPSFPHNLIYLFKTMFTIARQNEGDIHFEYPQDCVLKFPCVLGLNWSPQMCLDLEPRWGAAEYGCFVYVSVCDGWRLSPLYIAPVPHQPNKALPPNLFYFPPPRLKLPSTVPPPVPHL
jgi:hypothetical protein